AKAEAERKQAEAERKERAKQQKAEAGRKAAAERRQALADRKERAAQQQASAQQKKNAGSKTTGNKGSSKGSGGATAPGGTQNSPSAPASGSAASVVSFLKAQVGKPYVFGATGPSAYDCSGLTQAAFRQAGVSLPRTSQAQSASGTSVSLSSLQAGDLLYWGGKGSAFHVGVYVGNGQYIDAANPSKGISLQNLSGYPASGAVRVL
ncbi:NlpC/P60 family protein, partial [Streptomyces sp. T-3]|nr:NlpC/P60 family protein [Streptomyces sp. T-3]